MLANMIASLSSTPNEVVGLIAEQLHNEGQKGSLASLSSTSKIFPQQVASWLYRDVALDFSIYEVVCSARIFRALQKNATNRRYVRSLTVTCGITQEEMNHLTPCFPLIAKLVRQLDRLQSFSWHAFGNIPYSILRALHEHSNIRALDLHFYNCMQAALDIGLVKGLKDLERTPKLRAALLEISTHNLEHNTSKRRDPKNLALNKAVVQAPLLQTLTLRISHDIVWHEHEDRSLLRLSPEDEPMLQSLTNLKIHGPSAALHEGFLQAVPSYRLRVLELWHCGDCSTLLDILSNQSKELQLHTLKMEGRPNRSGDVPAENEAIESFLVSFEGLQELVLRGQAGMQMASITWHHNTLRSLSLIDSCDNLAPPDMRDITDHQMVPATRAERARKLEEIRGGCPNLRSLRINDDCGPLKHSADPVADVLSTFTKLHCLTLVTAKTLERFEGKTRLVVKSDYSEMDIYNIARNVAPPNLRWLQITDEARPRDDKVFVDVTDEHHSDRHRCDIYWHIDCTKSPLHLINMLSDTWQEKRLARLAKFLKAPYVSPDTLSHESLELRNEIVKTMLHEAQRRRTIVVNAIMQETRAKRGVGRWTKLSDTLGYEDLDEF